MKCSSRACAQLSLALALLASPSVAQLSFAAAWTVDSGQAASSFGRSLSGAGDVNGDGYDDVIVGAPSFSNGQSWEGRAFAYYGGPAGPPTTPNWFVESNVEFAALGQGVAGAGDVNGDGFDDVLVNASEGIVNPAYANRLYLGSAAGLATTAAWTVPVSAAGYGPALDGAGDLNADGYDDVIVGAPKGNKIYVYLGSAAGLPASPSLSRNAPVAGLGFGFSVSAAGDVNGDGFDDVIVGANTFNGGPHLGAAYVYLGSATGLQATPAWDADGEVLGSAFGLTVSGAGDVDGDGYDEVLVGAPQFADAEASDGRTLLYRGGPSGPDALPAWIGRGGQSGASFGRAVAGAGDVNADGYADVLIGSPGYDDAPASYTAGRLFVFLGSAAGLSTVPDWCGPTLPSHSGIGQSAAGGCDVNGDGFADVLGGGETFDSGEQFAQAFRGGHFASVAPYGKGKALSEFFYAPRLRSVSPPKLGGNPTINFAGGTANGTGVFLFAGLQPAELPFDGGTLYLVPFTTLFLGNLSQAGTYTLNAQIPATPSLQDLDLYLQSGFIDPAAPGSHHTVQTNALHWTLGM